jgi:hypothetical protein
MADEIELVADLEAFWPELPQQAPQRDREAMPHLCRLCFGPIERHAAVGVGATHWCLGCGSAGVKLADVCFCGVSRAGAILRCVRLAGEAGGPGEVVVVEADDGE